MERLFGIEYVQGYTSALMDVLDVLKYIQIDLKSHKRRQSYKTYKAVIECMLQNRVALREDPRAFIRCNDNVEGGFELYFNNRRK